MDQEKQENAAEKQEVKNEQAAASSQAPAEATKDTAGEAKSEGKKEAPAGKPAEAGRDRRSRRQGSPRKGPDVAKDPNDPEVLEKVISIKRITKVTKGGKKLSFSALVVVGDTMGKVGYSLSKASEVSIAIRKAMTNAKKNMVQVKMRGSTIPHEIIGECSGAEVLLKPASEGTGVIASGPVRAVCDGAGIHNILTKCHRSNNPINVVKATFDGLARLKTVEK